MRTTIDIPDELYSLVRARAARDKVSMRSLIVAAIEEKFKRVRLMGPPIKGKGIMGPLCPTTENPWDLIFSDSDFVP